MSEDNMSFRSLVVGGWMALSAVGAMAAPASEAVATRVLAALGLPPGSAAVETSPVPGFLQVEGPRQSLLYVSEDGRFLFAGTLYGNTPDRGFVDLREESVKPERQALLDGVPAAEQIIFPARGETKAHIYVFTDVDCGYCRKLHREVPELNAAGIEVRYLAYPRELGNPEAMSDAKSGGTRAPTYKKMVSAWCAQDRLAAMTDLKNNGEAKDASCQGHPVIAQYELGNRIGVRGTPALVLPDGTLQPGYLPAAELIRQLGL